MAGIPPQPHDYLSLQAAQSCLEHAPIAIFRIDATGQIIEANQLACQSLGYTQAEITRLTIFAIDPNFTPQMWQEHRRRLRQAGSLTLRSVHRRQDGSTFPVEITVNHYVIDGQEYSYSFARDLTDEARSQAKISESEYFLRKSQTVAHIGSYYMDTRNGSWIGSPELDEIFGIDPNNIKNVEGWVRLLHPDDQAMMQDYFQRQVLTEHQRFDKEYRIIRAKDGQVRWVHGLGELEFDPDGSVTKMIGTIQDITEHRQAEEEIHLNEAQLRMLTDNMADVIGRTNAQHLLVYATPSLERVLGYPVTQLLGKRMTDWIHPEDVQGVGSTLASARLAGETNLRFEFRVRHANGTYLWMEASMQLLYAEPGKPAGAIFSLRDISARKNTAQLLQALNDAALAMQKAQSPDQIFSAVADVLKKVDVTAVFFATDDNQSHLIPRYLSFNSELVHRMERITGLTFGKFSIPIDRVDAYQQTIWQRKTIYITSLEELTRQVLPAPIARLAKQLIRTLGSSRAILAPLIVDNEVIGQFTVQSVSLSASDIPSITAFANQIAAAWRQSQLYEQAQQEVKARKEAESQVRQLNEDLEKRVAERTAQLQASIRELEAFSYSVSHDLRGPLRAIDGFTSILAEDYASVLDAEGQRLCGVVRKQTSRMGELIDDLLAFSRLSRAELISAKINMSEIVRAAYQEVTSPAERKRIQLKLGRLPAAQGDAVLLHQVWVNLLSNAVKFSSKSARPLIQVQCTRNASETIYSIRDNGAGFNMQYSDKLFGVFQRLHGEKDYPGTGVGLAIVQRIIHRHNGRVWAEGVEGQGAIFYFSLPAAGK